MYNLNNTRTFIPPKKKPSRALKIKYFDDGSHCIYRKDGRRRFDMYVINSGLLVLISANGRRFKTDIKQ